MNSSTGKDPINIVPAEERVRFMAWAKEEGWHRHFTYDQWSRYVNYRTSLEREERTTEELYNTYLWYQDQQAKKKTL